MSKNPTLLVLLAAACASPPRAPSPPAAAMPSKGVEVGDLDRGVAPCDDFYEFANGAWRKAHPIPASMDRWSRRWKAGEDNKERLREILEELARGRWPAGSPEQLAGDFYAACTDEAAADAAGVGPLQPLLDEIDRAQSAADVQRLIRRLHQIAVPVPFQLRSWVDLHQPGRVIAGVLAGGLGLPDRDYYLKPEPRFTEARERYRVHLRTMLQLAGRPDPSGSADAIFALETRLAKASLDNVALRDPRRIDHPMSFAALQRAAPHLDWVAYYDEARLPHGDLNLFEPEFLAQVDRESATSPVALWRAYLSWRLLDSAAPWLSRPLVDEWFDFNQRYLAGRDVMKPRGTRCAESADELLGEAVGRKYVERYFPPAAKARVLDLVHHELAAMKDIVQGLAWMGPETKRRALEKLATFRPKIGYPDRWKDYSGVRIRRDAFWADVEAGRRFNVEDDRALIGKPTDRDRWEMTPPTSDASYNPLLNEVTFPAGILQPPAFDLAAVDAVNYGAIGVVIGHEISHGFDDEGAQFDPEGRLRNWWTPADLEEFHRRGQCVVDQFDGYLIEPGIHHNGKLVLGESIADLAGARIALRALERALQGTAPPPASSDGFTPEQQFFVAWGQFRGDATRPETQRLMVQGDPHPVARYRVVGPLSNLVEFERAFSCPATAPMVRPQRCEVW